jgi:hypothetical protein
MCEPGDREPDFSLAFDLPEVPRPGDYISVHREDKETPHTDLIGAAHLVEFGDNRNADIELRG